MDDVGIRLVRAFRLGFSRSWQMFWSPFFWARGLVKKLTQHVVRAFKEAL